MFICEKVRKARRYPDPAKDIVDSLRIRDGMVRPRNKKRTRSMSRRPDSSALRYSFRDVDLEETGDSRTQQVLMVGANKKVLEIGPATSYVTRALRQLGCEVTCVEIDAKAARVALRYANRTIQGDIETLDLRKALKDEKYDVILFGDVLEHLKDPSAVLKRVRPRLKRTGRVVATVPNIAHGSVRLLMLDGNFDTKPTGLLDSTHLHFYTRKTLVELFAVSGYSVQLVKEIKLPIHAAERLKVDVGKYPPDLIRAIESDPDATIYQFAVTARPGRMQARLRRVKRQRRLVSNFLMTQDTSDPLSTLLTIYHARPDLQSSFPEVMHGDYNRLLRWASQSTADSSRPLMERHLPWYRTNAISSANLENQLHLKDSHIQNLETRTKDLENQLLVIESSLAWRLIKRYRKFNDKWFPSGTKRRGLVEMCASAVRGTLDEGLSGLLHRAYHRHPRQPSIDEQYQLWLKNNQLTDRSLIEMQAEASRFSYKPKISIIMPVYNTDEKWLRSAIDSVMKQVYSNWELCIADDSSTRAHIRKTLDRYNEKDGRIRIKYLKENRGISGASNEALTMASGEFVGFMDHDDELTRDALFEVAKLLNQDQSLDLIYSDEDKMNLKGRRTEPFFKPGWSPDLLLSMNYVSHFTVIRRSLIDEAGGFRMGFEGSQDYDLTLRATELTSRIAHIDKPLYSWRKVPGSAAVSVEAKPYARESAKKALQEALTRRGSKGEVLDGFGGFYRVKYAIVNSPLVSIIIPTKDRVELLKRCIESIESKTTYRDYEIIIVDNNSTDPDTLTYLGTISHRVLKFNEPFNFSRINNFAARHAKGDHLVFLNNDTEIVEDCWLEAMLEQSQRSEVGMVGALLLYPTSRLSQMTVQHAGVILGLGGVANHAFARLQIDHPNYFGLHRVIRNCSAVTAACAMIRRSVFDEIGGFDENLKVAFGDVDLGLRVREKSYRVVYAPNAMLYHHECATRGRLHPSEDETYMINKWKHVLARGDPYYSPNLTLLKEDYSIAPKGCTVRPLAVLLEIYQLRPDLQRAYPEARDGDYQRLIDWAATGGTTADGARVPLRPYGSYYTSHASDVTRPLATLFDLYNSQVDLQRDYPEVLRGCYSGLISWANQVLAGNGKGEEYSALKLYEATYRSLMQSAAHKAFS